jgi:hypothetical protein
MRKGVIERWPVQHWHVRHLCAVGTVRAGDCYKWQVDLHCFALRRAHRTASHRIDARMYDTCQKSPLLTLALARRNIVANSGTSCALVCAVLLWGSEVDVRVQTQHASVQLTVQRDVDGSIVGYKQGA